MKRSLISLLSMLLVISLLTSCSKPSGAFPGEVTLTDAALQSNVPTSDNNRVFYEIFVGSFSDSDGDGIGDLRGIINRMDYLNDGDPNSGLSLGVEGLWLTPIFRSPSYHKYDVADFYTIDPDFGTEEDLKELLALCHERNVLVILDLPINHTSTQNAWYANFRVAHLKEDPTNEYYDFYSWAKAGETPSDRTFMQINGTNDCVECNFSTEMPEPDFDNPFVRETMLDVAKYYLDLGVDGFRFDAAKYIYFGDTAENVAFWSWYIRELKSVKSDVYTVAEVWDADSMTDNYYRALNCFDFTTSQVSGLISETAQKGDVNRFTAYVEDYLTRVTPLREDAMQLLFVSNHDMDRAAGYLTEASGHMRMAANLYLLSPGSPFIYYGEELGMRGSRGGANTDANRRLAMVWGDDDTVKNPEGTTYDMEKQIAKGAKDQSCDAASLYNHYKKLLMIRQANPEIARGSYEALHFSGTKAGGFVATWEGSSVCVLHNTTGSTVTLDLSTVTSLSFTEIRAVVGVEGMMDPDGNIITCEATLEGTIVTLSPQTSVVLGN